MADRKRVKAKRKVWKRWAILTRWNSLATDYNGDILSGSRRTLEGCFDKSSDRAIIRVEIREVLK